MKSQDAAYIAGFLDGEGCISIYLVKSPAIKRGVSFRPCVRITNTDLPILEWIQQVTGIGKIHCKWSNKPEKKDAYELRFFAKQAATLLKKLLPYLRVKKRQAELYLKFSTMHNHKRTAKSDENFAKLKAIVDEFRVLNKKGQPCLPSK